MSCKSTSGFCFFIPIKSGKSSGRRYGSHRLLRLKLCNSYLSLLVVSIGGRMLIYVSLNHQSSTLIVLMKFSISTLYSPMNVVCNFDG